MRKILTAFLLSGVFFAHSDIQANVTSPSASNVSVKENIQRIVFGVKISPYVKKVLITLNEKNVSYNVNELLPTKLLIATGQKVPEEFSKLSPLGKIPLYQEKGPKGEDFSISDSSVIMDFLEQTIKNNPLRPTCPKANARVSFMMKYADDVMASVTHKILFEKVVKPKVLNQTTASEVVEQALKHDLPIALDFLEKMLSEDKRTWIANTKNFSLADIAVVTHLTTLTDAGYNLETIIGPDRPHLLAYVNKVLSRDAFKKLLK